MTSILRRLTSTTILVAALVWLAANDTLAQPLDLNSMQPQSAQAVSRLRSFMREGLSSSERAIERTIDYEVVPTWNTNAYATITRGGQRRIQMFVGDMVIMQWLSFAMVSPRWGAPEDCVVSYISEMVDAIVANSTEQRTGSGRLVPVYSLLDYVERRPRLCRGFSRTAYERDAVGRGNAAEMHTASIRWVLAHELAHHLRGHLDERKPKGTRSEQLEQSRRNEREADIFALSEITRGDSGAVMMAMPAFLLASAFSCTVEEEPDATHPSAEWRWGLMVDAVRSFASIDRDFRQWATEQGVLERFLSSLDQMSGIFKR
jgi:hypothetical protein